MYYLLLILPQMALICADVPLRISSLTHSCLRQARLPARAVTFLVRLLIHSFIRYRTCEHGILKTNELVLMQIGTSGPQDRGRKRSTLGIGRSKVRVILEVQGRCREFA